MRLTRIAKRRLCSWNPQRQGSFPRGVIYLWRFAWPHLWRHRCAEEVVWSGLASSQCRVRRVERSTGGDNNSNMQGSVWAFQTPPWCLIWRYFISLFTLGCSIQHCRLVKSLRLALPIKYVRVLNGTLIYTRSHDNVFYPLKGKWNWSLKGY